MSINAEGFLSPNINYFIDKHRKEFCDEFALAQDLNRVAQAMLMATTLQSDSAAPNAEYLTALMFTRALSNFQGTILMAERGMTPEARTLARACFESASCVCAVAAVGEPFVDKMLAAEHDARRKFANWMLCRPDVLSHAGDDAEQTFRRFLTETAADNAQSLQWEQVAEAGGIEGLYVFYRMLSGDSAHAGIGALERYFDKQSSGNEKLILWGPNVATHEIGDTLLHVTCFTLTACAAFNNTVAKDAFHKELSPFLERYTQLLERRGEQ